ncbi:hypothetical protein DFR29_102237 [Tahibacter aquaticus]|uniref:Uncharacterized protein n=1 Tax=Tahibacter aquaticus TaxID=520092 RepID=A0A4R6Z731_9GAMM|nr:hypothetical protein [Tahibacter aquaticus]TDR47577.1 hypothetical protein DFR29_102237 [Tahibacter aquaticus]
MKTSTFRIRAGFFGLVGLLLLAPLASSQAADSNELGSPADTAQLYSEDYARLIEAALPPFRAELLARRLESVRLKYPDGYAPLKLRKISDLEALLGLPHADLTGSDYVANKTATYGIAKASGRVHFARNIEGEPPMAFADAQRSQREIEARHLDLLERAGIDAQQVLFKNTGVMALRTQGTDKPEDTAILTADSVFTYALRNIDGMQVEGSEAKLASRKGGDVVGLSLRWPSLLLHPQLTSFKLKSTDELKRELLAEVRKAANGAVVNVQMAVVLRPVKLDGRQVFVPSLKVGVLPKEEEGAMFYIDLPQQKLVYQEGEISDS